MVLLLLQLIVLNLFFINASILYNHATLAKSCRTLLAFDAIMFTSSPLASPLISSELNASKHKLTIEMKEGKLLNAKLNAIAKKTSEELTVTEQSRLLSSEFNIPRFSSNFRYNLDRLSSFHRLHLSLDLIEYLFGMTKLTRL